MLVVDEGAAFAGAPVTVDEGSAPTAGVGFWLPASSRFGSVAQFELIVGPPNESGTREDFVIQTPSLNSYVYNELASDC